MRNRFWRRLYTIQEIKLVDGHLRYVTNEDGTLFAERYRTKIKPEDLPEWFLYGRYYKRFGFLTAKGITDLLYIPSRFSNQCRFPATNDREQCVSNHRSGFHRTGGTEDGAVPIESGIFG